MSLRILPQNQKHYDDALAFAERRGLKKEFEEKVNSLTTWSPDVECELYPDAPHSFGFVLRRHVPGIKEEAVCETRVKDTGLEFLPHSRSQYDHKTCGWCGCKLEHSLFMFNGGLLYYGKGEDGVAGPQFSVRLGALTGDLKEGWEIHT